MSEKIHSKIESEDDKLEGQFVHFVEENSFNAHELREAYLLLCGISEGVSSERVMQLKVEMEKMTDAHYPLNRFAKMIGVLEEWESSIRIFNDFVSTLDISQKEKDMLISIVDRTRTGVLEVYVNGIPSHTILIESGLSREMAAYALKIRLQELLQQINSLDVKPKEISCYFEER